MKSWAAADAARETGAKRNRQQTSRDNSFCNRCGVAGVYESARQLYTVLDVNPAKSLQMSSGMRVLGRRNRKLISLVSDTTHCRCQVKVCKEVACRVALGSFVGLKCVLHMRCSLKSGSHRERWRDWGWGLASKRGHVTIVEALGFGFPSVVCAARLAITVPCMQVPFLDRVQHFCQYI